MLHQSELEENAEDVIHDIRQSSSGKKEMTSAEWKKLYQAVDLQYPTFKDTLLKELGTFTDQQMQVCYLIKIGLSKPQIQNITNLSRATIWRWVKKYDWIHEVTPKVKQSAGINYHH
jgi:DNA-binding NarL/FixJ family response regulator